MTPLLAILELTGYIVIALIVFIVAASLVFAARQRLGLRRTEQKPDLLLKHNGVRSSSRLSLEVQALARDPDKKIAAIKLHREQNAGLSLADAKRDIENFGLPVE